jgi:DNA-binding CsgD family transcriptional regulator
MDVKDSPADRISLRDSTGAPARLLRRIFSEVSLDAQTSARLAHLIDDWFDTQRAVADSYSGKRLLWQGRVAEALSQGIPSGPWTDFWYPGLSAGETTGPVEVVTGLEGLRVLTAFLRDHDAASAAERAERILRLCPMGEAALESLIAALATLIYTDRLDRAARWCLPLLEQTTAHCDPVWLGEFAAIQAEIHLRRGNPEEAERCAHAALRHLSRPEWGVALGLPLAAVVSAKLALGKKEEAARYLAVPLPEATFQTPAGLHYRCARAEYALATGAPAAALQDFSACGQSMARWGMDLPGMVPWRLGAARARLAQGRPAQARELIDAHLALLPPVPGRARGVALRWLAETEPVPARQAVLEEAVEVLQLAHDQAELAVALKALAALNSRLGHGHRARLLERRAATIEQLGAQGETEACRLLSDAERRVAALAAQGYTNRRIAERLYISVSTVEQHLTHIYRKLGISRRLDLPAHLD